MNCKFCNAELPEEVTLCPECGKENLEEAVMEEIPEEAVAAPETVVETVVEPVEETPAPAPAPKQKPMLWLVILAAIGAIALATVLISAVIYGVRSAEKAVDSYTVGEAEALKAKDVVVATVGTEELTNSELQIYYWQAINEFYSYYGYYMDMSTIGLDLDQPLDQQYYSEEDGITWQKYFIDSALSTWSRYAALTMAGKEAGYELEADALAYIETIPEEMDALAVSYGYASAEEMLTIDMSPACDMTGYMKFMNTNIYAGQYVQTMEDSLIPTMDEIEAYYAANTETLNDQGIEKDDTMAVSVRHILVCPAGGTEDDEGNVTYSDAEWAAAEVKAKDLYDQWLADGTEDGFATLATEYTEDPGSADTGGLYTDVQQGDMVEAFDAWCFEEGREYGDSGIVQTEYGFHLMYFVDAEEVWITNVENTIISERSLELVNNAVEKWPMEADYKKMVIGETTTETAE